MRTFMPSDAPTVHDLMWVPMWHSFVDPCLEGEGAPLLPVRPRAWDLPEKRQVCEMCAREIKQMRERERGGERERERRREREMIQPYSYTYTLSPLTSSLSSLACY